MRAWGERLSARRLATLGAILLITLLWSSQSGAGEGVARAAPAAQRQITLTLIGRVVTTQEQAIDEAEVQVFVGRSPHRIIVAGAELEVSETDAAGFYIVNLALPEEDLQSDTIGVEIHKAGFRTTRQGFARQEIACANTHCYVRVPDVVMPRTFNPAFFIASGIFVVVFGVISLNLLHETIAAFLGAAAMLGVSYFAGTFDSGYWIIGFDRGIEFIDFDVIFLLMTMMIFMAIMSQTGVFQWLAFQTYRLSRGAPFIATVGLLVITGVTSAVLNDTTVMLLMTPVSIQIALALGVHPAAIVVPEVLASNIGGAATLIGTPPNTIIGSYVGLGFNQFLVHMLPISLMSMVILIFMTRWIYREEYRGEGEATSEAFISRLEEDAQITQPGLLRKSLILFGLTLILFFIEDFFHMPPAVVAIIGSTLLLLWVRPDVNDMLREVDWTTLVFFMSLFMMVGGIQEVGLIQLIAQGVQEISADNLLLAAVMIIWVSAVASAIVANIPFTSAIVPVTVFLTQTLPGAENNVLYWALALGAGLGGNATYIGSAPNIVAMGIMDRAGYRIKFIDFSKVGVPVTFVTILVPTLWVLLRYFVIGF
jgi:Na+/H+ antiporter NhaD/arsenite permease-like protein